MGFCGVNNSTDLVMFQALRAMISANAAETMTVISAKYLILLAYMEVTRLTRKMFMLCEALGLDVHLIDKEPFKFCNARCNFRSTFLVSNS